MARMTTDVWTVSPGFVGTFMEISGEPPKPPWLIIEPPIDWPELGSIDANLAPSMPSSHHFAGLFRVQGRAGWLRDGIFSEVPAFQRHKKSLPRQKKLEDAVQRSPEALIFFAIHTDRVHAELSEISNW